MRQGIQGIITLGENSCSLFDYDSQADAWATPFNALAPDVKAVPLVSTMATRDKTRLYVLAVNRSTDQPVEATLRVHRWRVGPDVLLRRLDCKDFDLPGVDVVEQKTSFREPFRFTLPAHSACVATLGLMAGD